MPQKNFFKQNYLAIGSFFLALAGASISALYSTQTAVALPNEALQPPATVNQYNSDKAQNEEIAIKKKTVTGTKLLTEAKPSDIRDVETLMATEQTVTPAAETAVATASLIASAATINPMVATGNQKGSIPATLSVLDKTYSLEIREQSTVYDFMKLLAEKTDFSFSGKDHSALGFFVEEINGKKTKPARGRVLDLLNQWDKGAGRHFFIYY